MAQAKAVAEAVNLLTQLRAPGGADWARRAALLSRAKYVFHDQLHDTISGVCFGAAAGSPIMDLRAVAPMRPRR